MGAVACYVFKINDISYSIFDTLANDDGRTRRINGRIPVDHCCPDDTRCGTEAIPAGP
jgi:hypothetical protein